MQSEDFVVVVNNEEQYSIWPSHRPVPPGWRVLPERGSRDACLAYIERVWTDMRPLSLRNAHESRQPEPGRMARQ